MSRVDAVRIAVEKARAHGHSLEGAVLASDAFFPFADGPEIALEAGIAAIIQPGGSKRDDEVVAAVREPAPRWSSPAAGTSGTDAWLRSDLEPEHDLVAMELSGALEAVALVERDRAALALTGARRHRTGASRRGRTPRSGRASPCRSLVAGSARR